MSGPLAGLRVIDLSAMVLGPVATQVLGDMGADVIKIETPGGDPMRHVGPSRHAAMAAMFLNMNRNKRSVVLDLRRPAGHAALLRMVEQADVFVHNMRPRAAERLGVDYAKIAARNPKIVYAAAPGFRQDGPYADRPAYDDVIQGLSGVVSMNRRTTGESHYFPTAIADKTVGYVLASAIAMGLFHRERSGEGQEIQVPMFETMVAFNLIDHMYGGAFVPTQGGMGYPRLFNPHRRPYVTQDGHICVMAHTDDQWARFLPAIGCPELAEDPRFAVLAQRNRHLDDLLPMVTKQMLGRTTAQWQSILDAADIPNGPANELEDLARDPHLEAVGFFRAFDHHSEGPMMAPDISVSFSKSPGELRVGAPRLGEHTQSVLREFGFNDTESAEIVGIPAAT